MIRVRLAFLHATDGRLIVTSEVFPEDVYTSNVVTVNVLTTTTHYDDEDTFLKLVIAADFDDDTTEAIIISVLLAVAQPDVRAPTVITDVDPEQRYVLGLELGLPDDTEPTSVQSCERTVASCAPFSFNDNAEQFHDFLMNAPTPFVMVSGPNHVFTFINAPYVRILCRTTSDTILGRPLLEAIPELEGQACLTLLDKAYNTGVPQVRTELRNEFLQEETGILTEVYFDIVYYPVRDYTGKVTGVMAQATDVTERVLSRAVSEQREEQLYRLWAELETLYRSVPVGLAVVDSSDLKLLKLNRIQARFLGEPIEILMGKLLKEITSVPDELISCLYKAVSEGEPCSTTVAHGENGCQSWEVAIRPTRNGTGTVDRLTLIFTEANVARRGEVLSSVSRCDV